MPGTDPIFISHSTTDREDVVNLGHTLRAALRSQIRIFNTSDFSISPGSRWRERILNAISGSSMVILWATPNALDSKEVAFEIGAAFAYEKPIIPCCVHVPASKLPWSLSEIQAHTVLDKEEGWDQLAATVANYLNLPVKVDREPLLAFATRFEATSKAVEIDAIGLTVEVRNISNSAISGLTLQPADGLAAPGWLSAFQDMSLEPYEVKLLVRPADTEERTFRLTWSDAAGIVHTREANVLPTEGPVT